MKRELSLLVAVALLTAAAPLAAHHSFSATYFEDKSASLEGQVVEFAFRNPHSYVILETPGEKGETIRWAIEWASGRTLSAQGVTPESLKAFDRVVVTGNPGRDPANHRLRMRSITRPSDGWKWSGTFQ
jgi:hypothetical protein